MILSNLEQPMTKGWKSVARGWSKEWDQFDLAEICRKLSAKARRSPGEAQSLKFKDLSLHVKLVKAGESNGDGEVWKIGLSKKGDKWPRAWEWEMFLWAMPVIFQVDEMLGGEKIKLDGRRMISKEYTLEYRYDFQEAREGVQ